MATKHNPGDAAFIAESSRFIRGVRILKIAGGFVTRHQTSGKQVVSDQRSCRVQYAKEEDTTFTIVAN